MKKTYIPMSVRIVFTTDEDILTISGEGDPTTNMGEFSDDSGDFSDFVFGD